MINRGRILADSDFQLGSLLQKLWTTVSTHSTENKEHSNYTVA